MELLVNNKIISLDLPVADVYRKIWQPARENEPMRIVYRMRGLLGDATEDMVNTLQSNNGEITSFILNPSQWIHCHLVFATLCSCLYVHV